MSSSEILHSARVAVQHDDRFLLLERCQGEQIGKFEFPGGGVNPDESPAAAGLREVREETGLDVELITNVPYAWDPREIRSGKHASKRLSLYSLLAVSTTPYVELTEGDHKRAVWARPERILQMRDNITADTIRTLGKVCFRVQI